MIYCSPFEIKEFLQYINTEDSRFESGVKAVEISTLSDEHTVGVLSLKPICPSAPFNQSYSCNHFEFDEFIQDNDWNEPSVKRSIIITPEALPYISSAITLLKHSKESVEEYEKSKENVKTTNTNNKGIKENNKENNKGDNNESKKDNSEDKKSQEKKKKSSKKEEKSHEMIKIR